MIGKRMKHGNYSIAIRMVADRDGFLIATVDRNLCVDCGVCETLSSES